MVVNRKQQLSRKERLMYDTASLETKKMIVNCLIKRIKVYRDYKLHIDFNIDFEQFSLGLDMEAFVA